MGKPSRTIRSTEISIGVIEAIKDAEGLRVTELAEHLDIAKSTAHSHLITLENHGYVVNEGGIYHTGLKFLNLGQNARQRQKGGIQAKKWVKELSEEIGEEVDFSVEEHGRAIPLYANLGRSNNFSRQLTGERFYMHNTSVGKAILAELPRGRVQEIIDKWGLPKCTDNTVTSEDRLFNELEKIQEQGYAINDEESMEGLRAVACPVIHPTHQVCGSISITGPTYRITREMIENNLLEMLNESVAGLEEDLKSITTDQQS